ncbi:(S)-N-methylcoclaurine 3'-hydroxylase isozyme 2-like [Pistacia vera]|uniref:(S)-N-methylcoclaurine 3'-hydroxylase isozyme 2-like n=1 Tax=Pistacia vera TaxID=55513 RepID=UPI00126353E0|nr:(S)-N-methylcoclaurine 3'-hydroxylase isozyme 2-like [Pistacia vera]
MASIFIPVETYLPITLLLLVPAFLLLILKIKFSKIPVKLPPGPKPWPIIGNLSLIGDNPHVSFAQISKTYGPLISVRLGSQLVVVGSSPDAAAAILKTHDRELSGRHVPCVSFAREPKYNRDSIAWTFECTEEWKNFRALMKNELFGSKIVDSQFHIREKKIGELVEFLGSKEGQKVQIREVLFVTTFNSLSNIYLSKDFLAFGSGESRGMSGLVRDMMELWTAPNISDLFPILSGLDLQGLRKKADECVKKMCGIWDSTIKERRERRGGDHQSNHRDFLDALLDSGFSDEQISLIFVELLAAVSDSTTSTVEWALAELLKNPEAMNKIREELAQGVSEDFVTEENLANLPYLYACVKETLRLHPPAPLLLPHRAIEDCEVMKYTIPKDSQVFVNVWAIARDPTIWEKPFEF